VGNGYQVDLSRMNGLVDTLRAAAQSITSANTALRNASLDQLGSHELDGAAVAFAGRWEYGTGRIADLTGQLVQALTGTNQAYQDVEDQLSEAFRALAPATRPGSEKPSRLAAKLAAK